ncbi:hypothetical protein QN277_024943 [Acacia crassicarpa]|uniref:Uncharacterized protein n=1 Tax=Acacia crassicarpa TaxID=499986 RepID=A0AAE1JGD1_9FABA|nr:hypothetical protein QN277_024943 [Acacia crassicarpa]
MATNIQLASTEGQYFYDPKLYRSVLGKLQYLCYTRPEISFAVNKLCRFLQNPRDPHWVGVKRILRYLAGTINYGLLIRPLPRLHVQAFADSDWATNKEDRRSISGYCTFLGTNPVIWVSKCQSVVSRSAIEAEYRSLADASSDVVWVMKLLQEMHVPITETPIVWCDNSGAIALASNPVLHSKTKHVEIDIHFLREKVATGHLQIGYVPSSEQVADVLTKPLGKSMFLPFRDRLNVFSHQQSSQKQIT